MRASHALRWLAGGVLVLWCGVFLRMETTEKSMVRALIVQPNRSGWAVQLLYQFPEAAADASDAVAEIRSCSAEDATLPLALHKAERELPKAANYRLCEYLLFDETASQTDILELEEFLQTESVSRLSARVFLAAGSGALTEETPPDGLSGGGEEPEETVAAPETLPGTLLQAAEDTAARAPHLYECAAGAVIPILNIEEDRPREAPDFPRTRRPWRSSCRNGRCRWSSHWKGRLSPSGAVSFRWKRMGTGLRSR